MQRNEQYAPFPEELVDLVAVLKTPPEVMHVVLVDEVRDEVSQGRGKAGGLTLEIRVHSDDGYGGGIRRVRHLFPVPAATFNRLSWTRWLFDRLEDVRRHELCEYFEVDGFKPFAPLHGPGDNPYVVHDWSTDEQRRTQWTGEVKQA